MNCRDVIDRLEALLEGAVSDAERRAALEHVAACPSCRDLRAVLVPERESGDAAPLARSGPSDPSDMTRAILERTSGAACGSARELLCDRVDGEFSDSSDEDKLLVLHLEHCAACAGLESVLRQMRVDLPRLAELKPDARFTRDVLSRTVPSGRRVARAAGRFAAGWEHLLRRPRVALEGAYLGAILLVLVQVAVPQSLLGSVPGRALEIVRTNPVEEIAERFETPVTRVVSGVGTLWRETSTRTAETSRGLAAGVARRSTGFLDEAREGLGTLWRQLASQQVTDDESRQSSADDGDGTGEKP